MGETRREVSWKKLLGKHGHEFLSWVEESGIRSEAFLELAADLEGYLLHSILVSREACETFVSQLPAVLERCDEDIYNEPLVPEAYAHVHLLDRYRRFWDVLVELTKARVLPMRRDGIDVLDVGTGPAPALYAVADFYDAMYKYGEAKAIPSLATPPASLESVESSVGVMCLVHTLSELGRRRGPFRATFADFRGLNLHLQRAQARERWTTEIADEMESSEQFARWWINEFEPGWRDVFRYDLCILSNFLTQPSMVPELRNELEAAFTSLRPGGVVVVVGGAGAHYPAIYRMVDLIADETGVRRIDWIPDNIPCVYGDAQAERIKKLYDRVWTRLEEHCGTLAQVCGSLPQDLCDPETPLYGPRTFALRVFRAGKW